SSRPARRFRCPCERSRGIIRSDHGIHEFDREHGARSRDPRDGRIGCVGINGPSECRIRTIFDRGAGFGWGDVVADMVRSHRRRSSIGWGGRRRGLEAIPRRTRRPGRHPGWPWVGARMAAVDRRHDGPAAGPPGLVRSPAVEPPPGRGGGLGIRRRSHSGGSWAFGFAMTNHPLASLLEKLCSGDPVAAERVFVAFEPYLRMVVRKKLPPRLRAKFDSIDVVQSVWADLLRGFREAGWRFADEAHLRAFLVKLTRNRFI